MEIEIIAALAGLITGLALSFVVYCVIDLLLEVT